ncbi:MAG: hypothetical protein GTO13_01635 [Proteobacteria bacterium]|nr:hypothetical protein [Pseudomonadota bacterium]
MEWTYPGACKSLGRVVVAIAVHFSGLLLVAGPSEAQSYTKLRVMTSLLEKI